MSEHKLDLFGIWPTQKHSTTEAIITQTVLRVQSGDGLPLLSNGRCKEASQDTIASFKNDTTQR